MDVEVSVLESRGLQGCRSCSLPVWRSDVRGDDDTAGVGSLESSTLPDALGTT